MAEARLIVDRLHEAFNARRFDAYAELLTEDVVMVVDGRPIRGRAAVCDYAATVAAEIPGARTKVERVVAESGEEIVTRTRFVDVSPPTSEPATFGAWRLPLAIYEVYRVAGERIAERRSYVDAEPFADQFGGDLFARAGVIRLMNEQAALRRVATLVARGAVQSEVFDAIVSEAAALFEEETWLVRFDVDASVTVLAEHNPRIGVRPIELTAGYDAARVSVLRSGRPLRIDDYSSLTGTASRLARDLGVVASAAAPVVVQGTLWGAVILVSRGPPLAAGIEDRLALFADLAATAIANAQSRAELSGSEARARALAAEQAALRRVATLVAEGAGSSELFAAVAREVSAVVGIPAVGVNRFGDDGTFTMMGVTGDTSLTVGTRWPVENEGLAGMILATGRPARKDDYETMTGPLGDAFRGDRGIATVGVPIVVEGRIWGSMVCATRPGEAIPDGAEERLSGFTELVATAIANSQSREHLARLHDEQAALRRVAELVARGAPAQEVFDRVTVEASRLLGVASATLLRYERSGTEAVISALSHPIEIGSFAPGAHFPVKGETALAQVWRTGRSARTEGCDGIAGAQSVPPGVEATVFAPVVVEGRPWGALGVSTCGQPLPSGTEERLAPFCELVAVAIANADYRAKLTASRARVVASADEARRRLVRDVHDGAQQRLVHTLIMLRQAQTALQGSDGAVARLVEEALAQADAANVQLRELVRGIMPSALTRGGLRAGVQSLVDHMTLPVDAETLDGRLPEPIETTAYFVIAEALTNVVKHAGADRAQVRALVDGDWLEIEVSDNGRGGADPAGGSGLIGLADRVEAAGGSISVSSPPGAGTRLTVTLPTEPAVHESP